MSTPNPNPDPHQIQQAIEASKVGASPIPLEVRLETGQIYKGATPQDVLNQLVAAQTEASRTITQERAQREQLQQEVAALKAQLPPPPQDATEAEKQNYYQKWAQDPDEALQQQFGKMLNIPTEKVKDVLRKVVESTVVNSAADEFTARYPNFPNTAQNAQLINARLKERFGQSIEATTADNIELVYSELVRNGRITPDPMMTSGVVNQGVPVANIRGFQAPPNQMNELIHDFAKLPLDDMKKTIERLQSQGAR